MVIVDGDLGRELGRDLMTHIQEVLLGRNVELLLLRSEPNPFLAGCRSCTKQEMYVKPNTIVCTSVIDAYARSGTIEGTEKGEDGILLHGGKPRGQSQYLDLYVNHYSKCKSPKGTQKGESLLNRLKEMQELQESQSGDVRLNTYAYNSVLMRTLEVARQRQQKGPNGFSNEC